MRLASFFIPSALGCAFLLGGCGTKIEPIQADQPGGGSAGSSGGSPVAGQPAGGSAASGGAGGGTLPGGQGSGGSALPAAGSDPGGGSGGSGGSSGSGGQAPASDAVQPSLGCNIQPTIEPGTFAPTTIGGRQTWIHLPPSYDASRAYPVIFVWKGCSTAGVSTFGLQDVVGEAAILAQIDFAAGQTCYDTADNAMYIDLPVFDAVLEHLETNHCVDKAHVFSVGFSSGAWLTQLLACQRGDLLRGIGTIAGAFKPAFTKGAQCAGDGLSAFMVSDLDDHTNPFYDEDSDGDSVEVAVNHWLTANGCSETSWSLQAGMPTTPDMAVCRGYAGCGANPVTLCLTSGKGHAPQEGLSMPGMWQMFQATLPK